MLKVQNRFTHLHTHLYIRTRACTHPCTYICIYALMYVSLGEYWILYIFQYNTLGLWILFQVFSKLSNDVLFLCYLFTEFFFFKLYHIIYYSVTFFPTFWISYILGIIICFIFILQFLFFLFLRHEQISKEKIWWRWMAEIKAKWKKVFMYNHKSERNI